MPPADAVLHSKGDHYGDLSAAAAEMATATADAPPSAAPHITATAPDATPASYTEIEYLEVMVTERGGGLPAGYSFSGDGEGPMRPLARPSAGDAEVWDRDTGATSGASGKASSGTPKRKRAADASASGGATGGGKKAHPLATGEMASEMKSMWPLE